MDWKVQLEGEDTAVQHLQGSNDGQRVKISRDGVGWFLESNDFMMLSDHQDVRAKANEIVQSLVTAGGASSPAKNVGLGSVVRIHYDNSKTVYRAEA